MPERQFVVTHSEDTFQVGRLEGESFSGVYLSPAYMDRLREVFYGASHRLHAEDGLSTMPDAFKNLFGIVKRLTLVHGEQLKAEGYPWTEADRAAIVEAERMLKEASDLLRGFPSSDDTD